MTPSTVEVLARFPRAAIDHDNIGLYRGLLERRFLVNRCGACGWWHHPPRPICPECWSENVSGNAIEGIGTVYMMVAVHSGGGPPEVKVTVELVEQPGLRITCTGSDDLLIGDLVRLSWTERDEVPHPVFVRRDLPR